MARKALITWGGWEGHEPEQVARLFRGMLEAEGFEIALHDTLDCLADGTALQELDLIVPVWTMSEIAKESVQNVSEAVARGTGLAGVHGGMCDAFRNNTLWQFMTGGNWVAHPGGDGVRYRVTMANSSSPLVAGIGDFDVESEQYYLHVDPANEVLATTRFPAVTWYHSPNGPVEMPVAWTKRWGLGRVYYNALGHKANVIDHGPAQEMIRRGLLWAAEGKAEAAGGDVAQFASPGNHL
ncbi:ThuA domain-containing protein [Pseudoruegeria sp. SHC-113]|uniref:ThuA domain-containing protein n=1 Tax=Pseudoruegeria sp. SHC-113 TaxID=2855439 RepID=UPI0021BB0A21|nr:ThuA domain-containing protein [Pseudoruegeria sp. SHC-113]MCT8159327.1 ThuA domain-containing protein [Pseudoruegeria sp. SHC-113]